MPPRGFELPAELYEEIISYLWNDIPSLKACSLANRMMTYPSQKRLFYCICLRPPLRHLREDRRKVFENGLCGTSYRLRQLLLGSPHIANYIVALTIFDYSYNYKSESDLKVEVPANPSEADEVVDDGSQYVGYKLENGEPVPLDEPLSRSQWDGSDSSLFHHRWLPKCKSFPLCAPLLCNLQALNLFYDAGWFRLSGRVLITILNLMQLPSLRYFRAQRSRFCSHDVINQALGVQVKHLALRFNGYASWDGIVLPQLPSAPVHLESLSIDSRVLEYWSDENWRIDCGRLRKLVIWAEVEHTAAWSLIQSCSATLEDLEIIPSRIALTSRLYFRDNAPKKELIDLSKLPLLRRFTVTLGLERETITPFIWISRILRSGYSMSVTQQLEDISIQVHYFFRRKPDIQDWKPALVTLLEDEFINLRNFKIVIEAMSESNMELALEGLNESPYIESLRSRENLVVDIRAYEIPRFSLGDVRWEGYNWRAWK